HHCGKALILECPWTNLKSWVDEVPAAQAMMLVPKEFYPDGAFDNEHFLTGKHAPVLFVITTPLPNHGELLYEHASEPKAQTSLQYARKLDIPLLSSEAGKYTEQIKGFLNKKQ
ncbi:MAG: hypothetical protein ACRD3W_11275, partial [Terriglobales bacterium]